MCLSVAISAVATADEPLILNSATGDSVSRSKTKIPVAEFSISEAQARASVQWLAELAIDKAPRVYQGDKDWGKTKEVWSGLKVYREGLRISTKRRKKNVRHGRWVKYELTLPESKTELPVADRLNAMIHSVTKSGDLSTNGFKAGNSRWEIASSVETPMRFTARVERWNRGIQLISLSISGHIRVRLNSKATLGCFADYGEVPPALVISPRVVDANLELKEFEVERISKIGGDVADEWGEIMEGVVRNVFLKRQNEKLVDKLNASIDKHRDDLRISMADWLSGW